SRIQGPCEGVPGRRLVLPDERSGPRPRRNPARTGVRIDREGDGPAFPGRNPRARGVHGPRESERRTRLPGAWEADAGRIVRDGPLRGRLGAREARLVPRIAEGRRPRGPVDDRQGYEIPQPAGSDVRARGTRVRGGRKIAW